MTCSRCGTGLNKDDYIEMSMKNKYPEDGNEEEQRYVMCRDCWKIILKTLPPPEIEYFPEAISQLKDPDHAPYYRQTREYKNLFGSSTKI